MTIVQKDDDSMDKNGRKKNQKIAVPLVEPAAEIHHPDTYWVKNKSTDNEGARGREREEEREKEWSKFDTADVRQRKDEEVQLN